MSNITHYELTTIIDSNIPDNEHPEKIEKIKKLIVENKGKISSENNLGRKKLSYPIEKSLKGVFVCLEFDIEPKTLKSIEKELKLNKSIIRYLIIKKPQNVKPIIIKNSSKKLKKETSNRNKKSSSITTPDKPTEIEKTTDSKEGAKTEVKEELAEKKKLKSDDKKADLNELDKKLNEILNDDIIN